MAGCLLRRALLLLLAPVMIAAVMAGLARVGFEVGPLGARAPEHGPLLVIGVFGTVIALERAVALGRTWGYAGACFGGLAALALLARTAALVPPFVVAASVGAVVVNVAITRRGPAAFTWLMLLASVLFAAGNLAWLSGMETHEVVPCWIAFFVLTIVAERLELSRLGATPRWAERILLGLAGLCTLLTAAHLFFAADGIVLRGLGGVLALMAVWELRFDLARRTLRMRGLPRYAASAVLAGAGWLLVFGAVLLWFGLPPAGPVYDAALHSVFVGFVLSMVLAHAPIILPAVSRVRLPFHSSFYLPLVVLHLGLFLRVGADLAGNAEIRRLGSLLNAVALLLFVLVAFAARALSRSASKLRSAPASPSPGETRD
jgi:hypothetical protein